MSTNLSLLLAATLLTLAIASSVISVTAIVLIHLQPKQLLTPERAAARLKAREDALIAAARNPRCRYCGNQYGPGTSGLENHRRFCIPYQVQTSVQKTLLEWYTTDPAQMIALGKTRSKEQELNIGTLTETLRGIDALSPVLKQASESARSASTGISDALRNSVGGDGDQK